MAFDFTGRTFDLVAYTGDDPTQEVLLLADLGKPGQGGEICTGVKKWSQRWLVRFLTPLGSIPYRTDQGTEFLTQLIGGAVTSLADLFLLFAEAAAAVRDQLILLETDSDPADECFGQVSLVQAIVQVDRVDLYIRFVSRAGAATVGVLPVAFGV